MSDVAQAVEAAALRVIQAGVHDVQDLISGLPLPLELLAKGLLALPPVQAEITKLETSVADFIGKEVATVEAKAQEIAPDWLKKLVAQSAQQEPVGLDLSAKALDKLAHMTMDEIDALVGVK